jgi:hypothetical protein
MNHKPKTRNHKPQTMNPDRGRCELGGPTVCALPLTDPETHTPTTKTTLHTPKPHTPTTNSGTPHLVAQTPPLPLSSLLIIRKPSTARSQPSTLDSNQKPLSPQTPNVTCAGFKHPTYTESITWFHKSVSWPLSSEYRTYETVKARFCPWL